MCSPVGFYRAAYSGIWVDGLDMNMCLVIMYILYLVDNYLIEGTLAS